MLEFLKRLRQIPIFSIGIYDILQILILAGIIYYLVKSLYKTRAWLLVKGLLIIGGIYALICMFNFTLLEVIMQNLFGALAVAIVIMFQPELQRIVELVGQRNFTDLKSIFSKPEQEDLWYSEDTIKEVVSACENMSVRKTGAIIALQRRIPLKDYMDSGIKINADVSRQLLINIFEKNTPLHDGAVIIGSDKIKTATSYLPLSANMDIDKSLGTRHRAAIGVAEETDAIVVVVSEETGTISLCSNGEIFHDLSLDNLYEMLKGNSKRSEEKFIKKKHVSLPTHIKIIVPIISLLIWTVVMINADPVTTRIIYSVPVKTINTHVLDDKDQSYSIETGSNVSIKVQGRKSLVSQITYDDIQAVADFSKLSIVNAVPVEITLNAQYNSVSILSPPQTMKVSLEEMAQVELPIEVVITGDTSADYHYYVKDVELDKVTASCTKSIANTLDKVVVPVDVYGKDKNFIASEEPIIFDKNGTKIKSGVTLSKESIRFTIGVLEVQEIPLDISLAEQDMKGEAYFTMDGYDVEKDTIRIAAEDNVLKELKSIPIAVAPDSTSENPSSVIISLNQYLPEGVYLAKDQSEKFTINMNLQKYQKMIIPIEQESIKFNGYDPNQFNIEIIKAPSYISLYYNTSIVTPSMLTMENLDPTVKITKNEVGTYADDMFFTDIDGVRFLETGKTEYKLTQKETE